MTYAVEALPYEPFAPLFALDEADLAGHRALRVTADADRGFPCRVSLEDARAGETLVLVHHVSHDAATPYRSAYAIYVRENARQAAPFIDSLPPVFVGRPLGLRGFDAAGLLKGARLALPGEADTAIRALFADPQIAMIHAHNAAHGCFAARIVRHGDLA